MQSTLLYNHIVIPTSLKKGDLKISLLLNDGIQESVKPSITAATYNMYKLEVGCTYIVGTHFISNIEYNLKLVKTSFNFYNIKKLVPSDPKSLRLFGKCIIDEIIEAEVLWTDNRLSYYDFLYGQQ